MKKKGMYGILFAAVLLTAGSMAVFCSQKMKKNDTTIQKLSVNRRENPVGVSPEAVSFGWQMQSTENGKMQSAYRIVVADSAEKLQKEEYLWDSEKIESDNSAYIPYEGQDLESSKRYYWNVQVWEEETQVGVLSESCIGQEMQVWIHVQPNKVTTYLNGEMVAESEIQGTALAGYGFYQERGTVTAYYDNLVIENGQHEIIAEENFEKSKETIFAPYHLDVEEGRLRVRHQYVLADVRYEPAPMLRKEFEVSKDIENAYLYAASVGIYEPFINGKKVGDSYFSSGRQAYREQVMYDSYDVTECLTEGKNAVGVYLGHGWYDRAGYSNVGELGG